MRENSQLAIMFADIAGSTKLYETIGNDRAREVTSRCIALLSNVTTEFNGRVIKTIGDEVMCTFPTADEASKAAVRMQETVAEEGDSLGHLHIRIGFHFGDVILENEDVFGDAVNLAARMAAQAKGDQIMTTGETLDAMSPYLRFGSREVITTTVKGKAAPIQIIELTWGEEEELTVMGGRDAVTVLAPNEVSGQISFNGKNVDINEANPVITIGRDKHNTFSVLDSMSSRVHAKVECRRGKIVLVDQSTNGTFVVTSRKERAFVHRDEYILQGRGVIGLGREVNANDPLAVHFSC
ncbi:MAG: FHA domain-containing protein [Magnetococcales bacterium]|nr:FHA domain-containing protein [Magnetococcales bacterium]MBF0584175.1 FHA domain-containing protein [Magnetococcales bacterium]